MNMKLFRSLQVFVNVADTGSMSVTARSLGMTVSAISQQLRKLEQDIGLSLFNRNTRSLSLTEAGRIYYQTSKNLLSEAQKAQHRIEQMQLSPTGKLNIVAPEGFGGGLLSKPLQKLTTDFPKLSLSLTLTDEPVNIIDSGADVVLGFKPMSDNHFVSLHLATWKRILCVPASHALAKHPPQDPSELAEYCHIAHNKIDDYTLTKPDNEDQPLHSARVDVNSMQTLIQLTRDGVGYAVLPEPEIRHVIESGEMVQLLEDWQLPDYTVFAITPRHNETPVKIRSAVDCLKDWFATF
ncbi:LysR family transcriptional regulator [Alteromonas halophila]|uniref:LysR family transcriptional regulator n=1 Tax=Alteromonas halophila TaxID=516698 RepID=A0A918JFB9_9ALTE|nr:LysR family transcriptional regulator [Alteromonas halophila]GGW77983.1 LysR family transcriptional regulator [Alteromonas halophila]